MNQHNSKRLEKDLIASNLSVTGNFAARFAQEIENNLNNPFHKNSHQELWAESETSRNLSFKD